MGWATLRGLGLCQFLAIECCRFRKIDILFFMRFYVALKRLVSLLGRLVACSARIVVDRQTHRPTTVTLAAHAHRGLNISMAVKMYLEKYAPKRLNICKWLFTFTSGPNCLKKMWGAALHTSFQSYWRKSIGIFLLHHNRHQLLNSAKANLRHKWTCNRMIKQSMAIKASTK